MFSHESRAIEVLLLVLGLPFALVIAYMTHLLFKGKSRNDVEQQDFRSGADRR